MAKSKSAKQSGREMDRAGKVRLELRFDADVAEQVQRVAEDAGISVNQLLQAISRWAMTIAHPGEEARLGEDAPKVERIKQPGCVWFGRAEEELQELDGETFLRRPSVVFQLDFTERRAVVEGRSESGTEVKRGK